MSDKIIQKLDLLETHDRLLSFKKFDFDIDACIQDIIDKRPFGDYNFYIFAHTRTEDNYKRLIWQPRLTKPKAEPNSLLFKVYPKKNLIKRIWQIPNPEFFYLFQPGYMLHDEFIYDSILKYLYQKSRLEAKEEDDLQDEEMKHIYEDLKNIALKRKREWTNTNEA